MDFIVRRKLGMVARVLAFIRAHVYVNPGFMAAAARLEELSARANVLAQQELAARQAVTAALASREHIRQQAAGLLRVLTALAASASKEEPELARGIMRPRKDASNQTFVTMARVAVTTAVQYRDLLVRYGMPSALPEDLGALLDSFDAATIQKHIGDTGHVGARAELIAVASDLMGVVRQLDALNRFQFKDSPEQLAAWKTARDVYWPESGPAAVKKEAPAA
jgi:hypothetical protein